MGKRKAAAPVANRGRPEDRAFVTGEADDGGSAPAHSDAAAPPWHALEDSSDSGSERPVKRRRRQRRRRDAARIEEDDRGGVTAIVDTAAPVAQRWRFTELAVCWREAASSSSSTPPALEDGQLLLSMPGGNGDGAGASLDAFHQSGRTLWQGGVAAPDPEAAEALLLLLRSGHVGCAVACPPGGGAGALLLGLTAKAAGDAAEHPEEPVQRQWHRQLLQALRWLLPRAGLDPDEPQPKSHPAQPGAEPPASPLASPRGGATLGLARPLSPLGAAGAAPAFDAAELYAAVKPTGREPQLPASATAGHLLPTLRSYQARAAQWMVRREQGTATLPAAGGAQPAAAGIKPEDGAVPGAEPPLHPLWRAVPCRDGSAAPGAADGCFYLNPYNGRLSLQRFPAPPEVRGGIIADEMGLGKTVELLALIVARRYPGPPPAFPPPPKRAKRRGVHVRCVCGATEEGDYSQLWLQCDECDTWMHAACCGVRRAPPGEWVCGACQRAAAAARVAQPCGATLVVCPTPILHQWREEILRHVKPGALRLVTYEGQQQPGAGGSARVVTAADLAAADVVLTTYEALRRDVNHCPDDGPEGGGRTLRRRKKYEVMPTPLTRLVWWRVCLDEAQMVESSTAKAAEMALKLHTVHRWCVTGTPLSRGLEDLYGLLAFLQAAPYSSRHWWQRAVLAPYEAGSVAGRARLLALLRPSLGGLLWRSAKADVAQELGLPPQHHHLRRLQLSAIEKHFYARQHQECVAQARAALSSQLLAAASAAAVLADGVEAVEDAGPASAAGPGPASPLAAAAARRAAGFEDRSLTRREEGSLLHPLLRLRQACCHPQVGGAGIKGGVHGHGTRAPLTMGEVLDVMLSKSRVEAEDAQRLLLASLNGLAGLLLLQARPAEAVRTYREALATIEQNKALVRTDPLQQLHTLSNLAHLLGPEGGAVEGVAPTLRDAELEREAAEIREEYLAESLVRLSDAAKDVEEVERHTARAKAPLLAHVKTPAEAEELLDGWYMRAVALIAAHGRDQHSQRAVADRIKEQLKEETMYLRKMSQNASSLAGRFRDLFGLEMVLQQELGELCKAQAAATEELERLQAAMHAPPAALVEAAASCGRCRGETAVAGRVCRHCKLEELFWGWEGRAYALYSRARGEGAHVSAEDAIRQAQQATLFNRVGLGGLGEAAAIQLADGAGPSGAAAEDQLLLGGRRDEAAAKAAIVRRPGAAEQALGLLLHQLRTLRVPAAAAAEKGVVLAAGRAHLELLELYRRLYLKSRALSVAQRQRLYSLDELEQCSMRIKLLSDNELRLNDAEQVYRVYAHEVPVRSVELSNDKASAEAELRSKLGTLRYLEGIKAREAARAAAAAAAEAGDGAHAAAEDSAGASGAGNGGAGPAAEAAMVELPGGGASVPPAAPQDHAEHDDICPICHDQLGQELVMLACAHRLCCRCSLALQERLPSGQPQASRRIECPVCRTRVPVSELVYVDARLASPAGKGAGGERADNEEDVVVRGSYGTKLEAVVARLAWLTRQDATTRVLVFSTWKDVLDLVSHALDANGLPHLYPRSAKKFEAAVAEFRSGHEAAVAAAAPAAHRAARGARARGAPPVHAQVLLLLLKQGANGLNLTEAQHVLLVEPQLDPAVEAQAVGRVDRIGQTRDTHVHRFVVERTIEENVHRLCQQRAASMDLSAASVKRGSGGKEHGALTVRDVAQLLRQPEQEAEEAEAPSEGEGGGAGEEAEPSPRQRAAAAAAARAAAHSAAVTAAS